jgi:hypothetical protein
MAIGLELLSSYFLYRYYAVRREAFHPAGLATLLLLDRALVKVRGSRRHLELAADHGPLFRRDESLGFAMYPGRYRITESLDNQKRVFGLTVDDSGGRVTSYAPVQATKRIFLTGDSAIFGWGLDDEETMSWLLQTRLPDYRVVNLALTSYSTIHAAIQLRHVEPKISANDVVILEYHTITNELNVASPEILTGLLKGYEMQMGDPSLTREMEFPYGAIDSLGHFSEQRLKLSCYSGRTRESVAMPMECDPPQLSQPAKEQVSERAFDEIIAMNPGRLIIMFVGGSDGDPVIAYLKSKGIPVADVRPHDGDETDVLPIDSHPGPFWHHQVYLRLLESLQRNHLVRQS